MDSVCFLFQISSLDDNLELVKFAASLEGLVFSPKPVFKAKDEAEATRQRSLGNEAFQKRDYQKALLHYTVSVIKSEHPTTDRKVTNHDGVSQLTQESLLDSHFGMALSRL